MLTSNIKAVLMVAHIRTKIPALIINWSYWLNLVDLDPDSPVILFYIIQEGVTAIDSIHTSPFHNIGPFPSCQKGATANPHFPLYLKGYNVSAQRKTYDAFATHVMGANSTYTNSIFITSTAFAYRAASLLVSTLLIYTPNGEKLDHSRDQLQVYANYAYGDEEAVNWYGYEHWRQERLGKLKKKYDPEGRFSFSAPVA
ncbi:hypothetical protein F5Y16DRAFT_408404 [Xylariaceae sp. FL0255]|nr:hypothetical protein F5Y16DRAFT_408404 [Xylariaceae sp. FL0255]